MKAQRKNGRVILDMTENEWQALTMAFRRTQYEAGSAQDEDDPNEGLQKDAAVLFAVEAAVNAASTTPKDKSDG